MSDAKKYFWLKLKEDFFEDETIAFIEEQENGTDYALFYLKLCLKSLKTEGKLMRLIGNTYIPYDVKALSKLTNTNIDTVNTAMQLFTKIGLISVYETGEIYINQIQEMIGKETDKARLMRESRAREKLQGNNVTQALPKCYPNVTKCYTEIEIEKDIELDIDSLQQKADEPSVQDTEAENERLRKEVEELKKQVSTSLKPKKTSSKKQTLKPIEEVQKEINSFGFEAETYASSAIKQIYESIRALNPNFARRQDFLTRWELDLLNFQKETKRSWDDINKVVKFYTTDTFWRGFVTDSDKFFKNYEKMEQRACSSEQPKYQKPQSAISQMGTPNYHDNLEEVFSRKPKRELKPIVLS